MNRPLSYSTPQRQAQYNTIKSAGLSRPDYRDAIKKLNKAEMKYRTAEKLKEKKQAQAEKERQERAAALAEARAANIREADRKKKDEKNRKRREKRAAEKAAEKAAEEEKKQMRINEAARAYIKDLTSNMRRRVGGTYDFGEAQKIGITPQEIIAIMAENAGDEPWVFYLDNGASVKNGGRHISYERDNGRIVGDNSYYTLSDRNKRGLYERVVNSLVIETATTESDGLVLTEIQRAESITISPIDKTNKNRKDANAFFKYHNKTNIDLSRYAIWKETVPSNYDETCLVVALVNGGLSVKKQEIIKRMIKNRCIPLCDLQKICDAAQIQIRVRTEDVVHDGRRVYGKEYDEVYVVGSLIEHYFIIEPTEYTSFSIKNYNELKDVKDFNKIYTTTNGKHKRDTRRYIDSFDLIKLMLKDKDTFFTEITLEDKFIASTQFYDKVNEEITHLEYNVEKCVRPVGYGKMTDNKMKNVFFDFETNPNGEHKAYLCRTYDGKYSREFIGENCGLQMLFSLKSNTRLIAHNATYDFRFLIQYLRGVSELARGNKLISAKGRFNDYKIEIKDSYHLITMPLRNFPKVFAIENTVKEVMPYTLYTKENIEKRFVPIDEALKLIRSDEKEQFLNNIERWNLKVDDTYDIIKYSSMYCEIDCMILSQGYNTFRKWIKETFKLDIDFILTGASLAHQYFINEDCYRGVNELGGVPQLFIQGCVVGGRVMCAENKKIMLDDVVNDFDAVSLYPSAMFRMDGFLKGIPKVIENHDYNWIKQQDGYFIDITIKSVGIERKFPLMSYKNENGVRIFSNDMIGRTVRVDKYTLEDIIKFQGITFDVVRGYYFNEGFNTKVRDVITTIFNKRLEAKKVKNPIEMVYKLIMNSGYGKSIMKPVETESRFFDTYESEDKFNVFLSRNYNWITSFVKFGNKIKVNTVKTLIDHFNIAQVGVCILSNSKRIMNEVMCLAEDNDIDLYYQDTDSIHLKNEHISVLSYAFKQTYGRELIGKGLGQFHSDFDLPGCSNVVATKSIFLGKKSYIDKLEGTNAKGEKETGFHIRMKGIPEKCIHYVVEHSEKYNDVMDLYMDLYNGNEVAFDLTNGGSKANFKFNKNYTINTLSMFTRSVKF
jgi:hypothetical protein